MKIGLCYDLRDDYLEEGFGEEETAEFDRPDTIKAIESAIKNHGHEPVRIGHVRSLVGRLCAQENWDLVFNIAEGMYGTAREAQVPALLDAYQIPYTFSDGVTLSVTLHKAMTKRILRDAGLPTPDFTVVYADNDIGSVDLPFPIFAKPLAEGTGKGIDALSKIDHPDDLRRVCVDLLERFHQPVLVETFLPGREVTVGIVGTGPKARAIGTLEVVLKPGAEHQVYSYINKERCEQLVEYRLCTDQLDHEAREISLAAWRLLECRDAGRVDLRADTNGKLQILEINPLAGLHPEHSDLPILATLTGMQYTDLIGQIIESAADRILPGVKGRPSSGAKPCG